MHGSVLFNSYWHDENSMGFPFSRISLSIILAVDRRSRRIWHKIASGGSRPYYTSSVTVYIVYRVYNILNLILFTCGETDNYNKRRRSLRPGSLFGGMDTPDFGSCMPRREKAMRNDLYSVSIKH